MTTDKLSIKSQGILIPMFSILILVSCSVFSTKKNLKFQRLVEQQLGIQKILKSNDSLYCKVFLVNDNQIHLKPGYNFLNHPSSGERLKLFAEFKNGYVHKLLKADTLVNDNRIIKEEWIIQSNGGELNLTTTDLQGTLTHFYGQVFLPGQPFGNYTDTNVDSLGNSFTEWGVTGEIKKAKRKN